MASTRRAPGPARLGRRLRTLWLGGLVSLLAILGPGVCSAAPDPLRPGEATGDGVALERGLLSADLRNEPIVRVLHLLAARAGIAVTIHGEVSGHVSDAFADLPIDAAVRRLLRQYSVLFVYEPPTGSPTPALARVIVLGSAAPPTPGARSGPQSLDGHPPDRSAPQLGSAMGASPDRPREPGRAGRRSELESEDLRTALADLQERARRGEETAVPEIAALLVSARDPLLRAHAAMLLGIAKGDVAVSALETALSDADGAVRLHAVRALGSSKGIDALPVLMEVAGQDPDPGVRRMAVRWIGAFPGPVARAALTVALKDADASVREEAEAALTGGVQRSADVFGDGRMRR